MNNKPITTNQGYSIIYVANKGKLYKHSFKREDIIKVADELERLHVSQGEEGLSAPVIVAYVYSDSFCSHENQFWHDVDAHREYVGGGFDEQ